jgi:hypothetical protein
MTSGLAPIRLLTSDRDGEVIAAVAAIKRAFQWPGSPSMHSPIRSRTHRATATRQRLASFTMPDPAAGHHGVRGFNSPLPSWHETARWCQQHGEQLRPRGREFVDQMAAQTVWRPLTEKQGKWLLRIFCRLGGERP